MSSDDGMSTTTELVVSAALFGGGVLFTLGALQYSLGTNRVMGPGFFPLVVGIALTALAGIHLIGVALRRRRDGGVSEPLHWRPVLSVIAGLGAFGVTIGSFGLLPATAITVGIAAAGSREARLRSTLFLVAGCVVGAWIVFKLGLNVTIPSIAWDL